MQNRKKVIVTGASGYIGPYLCNELANEDKYQITAIFNSNKISLKGINYINCNILDYKSLREIFYKIKPEIVYHLASVTPTRIKIQDNNYIRKFNVEVTEYISKLCLELNSLLVYTSTDLVYAEGENITEDSSLNPLTIYAETKLEGEQKIQSVIDKYLIFRLSLVYGFTLSSYSSFYDTAYRKLFNKEKLNAFSDQYRNPVYVEEVAEILKQMPKLYSGNDVINLCGDDYLSRYEMCLLMAEKFGFNKDLILKSSCETFKNYTMVKKLNLNNSRLKTYGIRLDPFTENLEKSLHFKNYLS